MTQAVPVDGPRPSITRPLFWLTFTKFLVNAALRLAYPFNTDIAKGLGVSLDTVGRAQGVAEMTGLVSIGIGRQLDRGHYRRWVLVGVSMAGAGSILLGVGSRIWVFGLCFALVTCGVAVMTTSAQTWIGSAVPYAERGRVIGIYEASWAVALLVGAPIAGLLIEHGSWWWPFAVLGVMTVAIAPVLSWALRSRVAPGVSAPTSESAVAVPKLVWTARVIAASVSSTSLTLGATAVFASYGAWLKDRHGFTTGSISALTLGLGVAELVGSGSMALFSDRLGKRRSVAGGSLLMAVTAAGLVVASGSRAFATVCVIVFFGAFEFAYVSQISINSEVGGAARGRYMAVNASVVTLARAIGAALGTFLYVHSGIAAVSIVSVTCAVASVIAVLRTMRED